MTPRTLHPRPRLPRPGGIGLAVLLAALVIVPRSALIARAHSECIDDEYHLGRGVMFWHRSANEARLNDPPFGEGISAVPLVVAGARPRAGDGSVLYGQRQSPETLLMLVAVWKALLFLPAVAVAFAWSRAAYGRAAAWLAAAAVTFEPTFAAHVPVAAIDVLGTEGILVACFCAWRYFESPSWSRLVAAGASAAAAILLKHTAIVLPGVVAIYALLAWVRGRHLMRGRVRHVGPATPPRHARQPLSAERGERWEPHPLRSVGELLPTPHPNPLLQGERGPDENVTRAGVKVGRSSTRASTPDGAFEVEATSPRAPRPPSPLANEGGGEEPGREIALPSGIIAGVKVGANHPALIGSAVGADDGRAVAEAGHVAALRTARARHRRRPLAHAVVGLAVFAVAFWALTLFDVSRPVMPKAWVQAHRPVVRWLAHEMPAGAYVNALAHGLAHGERGHVGYLFGEIRRTGWWYYFPVVMAYKVPAGLLALFALAVASLAWRRPSWREWGLIVPAVAWAGFMMASSIDIGFRHFLPAYAFLILLASRAAAPPSPRPASAAPGGRRTTFARAPAKHRPVAREESTVASSPATVLFSRNQSPARECPAAAYPAFLPSVGHEPHAREETTSGDVGSGDGDDVGDGGGDGDDGAAGGARDGGPSPAAPREGHAVRPDLQTAACQPSPARRGASRWPARVAWACVTASAVHAMSFHPNYLSYFNAPRGKPYLAINDSNVDWGQSLKQVRLWIDANPHPGRAVSLGYFGRPGAPNVAYYVGGRAVPLSPDGRPPRNGVLILSPMWEAGVWDERDRYAPLRKVKPLAVIGDCMRVYDLDRVRGWTAWVRNEFPPRPSELTKEQI